MMYRKEITQLARKLLMLSFLLACLVVLSSDYGARQVAAAPCCSDCEAQEQYCYDEYANDPPWLQMCLDDVRTRCWRWCSFSC